MKRFFRFLERKLGKELPDMGGAFRVTQNFLRAKNSSLSVIF